MKLKLITACLGAALALFALPKAQAQQPQQYQQLLAAAAPSIVSVKIVFKTEVTAGGNSQNSEGKADAMGAVVSPDGLIMIATSAYSPDFFGGGGGGGGDNGFTMKTIPTSFHVTVGQESKPYTAVLVATDSLLGLSFIQITDLNARQLTAVDMSKSAEVSVGDQVIAVERLAKGYNYAPYFSTARISGVITLPRQATVLDSFLLPVGLPVYNLQGQIVGALTTLKPTVAPDTSGGSPFFGGGQAFLVPAASVNAVILQAKARAAQALAKTAGSEKKN